MTTNLKSAVGDLILAQTMTSRLEGLLELAKENEARAEKLVTIVEKQIKENESSPTLEN